MKKTVSTLVAALALTGCASLSKLSDDLNGLVGLPAAEAFKALGPPDSKMQVEADVVYAWSYDTYSCTVKLTVGPDSRVRSKYILGTDAGCEPYQDSVAAYLKKRKAA